MQYSLWLDQHSTDETLKFIKGALTSSANKKDLDEDSKQLTETMLKICNQG